MMIVNNREQMQPDIIQRRCAGERRMKAQHIFKVRMCFVVCEHSQTLHKISVAYAMARNRYPT